MAGVRTYAAATGRSSWPPWEYGGTNKGPEPSILMIGIVM